MTSSDFLVCWLVGLVGLGWTVGCSQVCSNLGHATGVNARMLHGADPLLHLHQQFIQQQGDVFFFVICSFCFRFLFFRFAFFAFLCCFFVFVFNVFSSPLHVDPCLLHPWHMWRGGKMRCIVYNYLVPPQRC